MLLGQRTELLTDCLRKCACLPRACDRLTTQQCRRRECEEFRRDTGALDVAADIFTTVPANVQAEDDVVATPVNDIDMKLVRRCRGSVKTPRFLRRWLRRVIPFFNAVPPCGGETTDLLSQLPSTKSCTGPPDEGRLTFPTMLRPCLEGAHLLPRSAPAAVPPFRKEVDCARTRAELPIIRTRSRGSVHDFRSRVRVSAR